MRIQNRIKITIAITLIITCIFSLTSCILNPLRRFKENKPEYDYFVVEFSETSYAWVDCSNADGYGEWTFNQKTIPILFHLYPSEAAIYLYSLENVCEIGEIYQYDDTDEVLMDYGKNSNLLLMLKHKNNYEQNKIATFRCYDFDELQDGMISTEQEVVVRKMTSEEWQQWMKEHSLDPNLYMQ